MTQTWKVFALFPLFALAPYMCPAQKPNVYRLSGDIAGTHDPSIIKEGKTWYVFATGKAQEAGRLQFAVREISSIGNCAATSSTLFQSGFFSAAQGQKICGLQISHTSITNTGFIMPTHSLGKIPRVLRWPQTKVSTQPLSGVAGQARAARQ